MARYLLAVVSTFVGLSLAGCSENLQLVKAGLSGGNDSTWTEYSPPRSAESPLEDAVLTSARTKKDLPLGGSKVYFIIEDPTARYVDVVRTTGDNDRFANKEVVRYRVIAGKIAAKTEKSVEIFPDADFERAVLLAASQADGPNPVVMYQDPVRPVSLTAQLVSDCAAVVKVYEGGRAGGGQPIAEKQVNGCFADNR